MTVIIAIDYLTSLLVISDSRVSYSGIPDMENGLQKVLSIISPDGKQVATLGFAGDVALAKKVFLYLLVEKQICNYQRPFIIPQLISDLDAWLQEIINQEWANYKESGISFIFCAIEPKIEIPIYDADCNRVPLKLEKWDKKYIRTWKVSENGKVLGKNHQGFAIIGSGIEKQGEIKKIREKIGNLHFPGAYHGSYLKRAFMAVEEIAKIFEQSKTVGGVFQVITMTIPINDNQILWLWCQHDPATIETLNRLEIIEDIEGVLTLQHETQKIVLYPIWHHEDWQSSGKYHGAIG